MTMRFVPGTAMPVQSAFVKPIPPRAIAALAGIAADGYATVDPATGVDILRHGLAKAKTRLNVPRNLWMVRWDLTPRGKRLMESSPVLPLDVQCGCGNHG